MALIFRFLGFVLSAIGVAFLNLAYLILTVFMRLLPGILNFLRFALQGFLRLSYRGYRQILTNIYPIVYQHLGLDAFAIPARIILSLLLSLIFVLPLMLSANMPWVWWILGLSCTHGFVVGLQWDQLEPPGGLQLGEKT